MLGTPYGRGSCRTSGRRTATDWVEKYPSHVVAKWLAHSSKVAAQHYLLSRDHTLRTSCATASRALWLVRTGWRGASQSATRNATPHTSVSGGGEPHETTNPLPPRGLQRVQRVSSCLASGETANWDAVCADARKTPPQGCRAFRETRSGRPGRSFRGSSVAHQPEDRCGRAIDRAILAQPTSSAWRPSSASTTSATST
jgi:hypothetical protein